MSNLVEIPFQANCRSVRRSRHPVGHALGCHRKPHPAKTRAIRFSPPFNTRQFPLTGKGHSGAYTPGRVGPQPYRNGLDGVAGSQVHPGDEVLPGALFPPPLPGPYLHHLPHRAVWAACSYVQHPVVPATLVFGGGEDLVQGCPQAQSAVIPPPAGAEPVPGPAGPASRRPNSPLSR